MELDKVIKEIHEQTREDLSGFSGKILYNESDLEEKEKCPKCGHELGLNK